MKGRYSDDTAERPPPHRSEAERAKSKTRLPTAVTGRKPCGTHDGRTPVCTIGYRSDDEDVRAVRHDTRAEAERVGGAHHVAAPSPIRRLRRCPRAATLARLFCTTIPAHSVAPGKPTPLYRAAAAITSSGSESTALRHAKFSTCSSEQATRFAEHPRPQLCKDRARCSAIASGGRCSDCPIVPPILSLAPRKSVPASLLPLPAPSPRQNTSSTARGSSAGRESLTLLLKWCRVSRSPI
jgi:hypothetical protein